MKSINPTRILKLILVLPALAMALAVLPGCKEGGAEDAGEKIDKAVDDVKDAAK